MGRVQRNATQGNTCGYNEKDLIALFSLFLSRTYVNFSYASRKVTSLVLLKFIQSTFT